MKSAIIDYVRSEPVRVGAALLSLAIIGVSLASGTSTEAIIVQVGLLVGIFERVRAAVTPFVEDLLDGEDSDG